MAKRILIICDVHGDKPCPKGSEMQTRVIYDMFTGKRHKKDLCSTEWEKLATAQDKLMEGTEPIREERPAEAPVQANGSKNKKNGRKEPHPYEPLILEIMTWHRKKNIPVPRGRFSKDRESTVAFLSSPEGEKWKGWEPGMAIPK